MKIIKNSKELSKLVDKNKNLHLENEDVRIEFEPSRNEINNVYCRSLFLMNDIENWNFNGGNFNGWNFNGGNFNGGKVSYYAFFNVYYNIKCESIEGRKTPHADPVCLEGTLVIIKPKISTSKKEKL